MTDSSDNDITNAERAKRFARVLRQYNTYDTDDCRLINLLADARHWCDRQQECYGDLDRIAHDHYFAELWAEWGAS